MSAHSNSGEAKPERAGANSEPELAGSRSGSGERALAGQADEAARARSGARGAVAGTTRSGFVALAGRPNVGKSTLTNAIVGAKVAIVSDKPQTTRRAIRGVATAEDWQLVLIDLPGPSMVIDQKLGAILGVLLALAIAWGGFESIRERRASSGAPPRSRRPTE